MKEYAYKDSGIEWLGEIPEHWDLKKLKRILDEKLSYGANEAAELEDPELPRYIRITDFDSNGSLRKDTFKSIPKEKAEGYYLQEGDILFARSGATVGKTFQFKNYNGKACYAGYLIKASPRKWQIYSDFLYFFTKSHSYESWKEIIYTQSTIQNIGADKYQYLNIPLPPLPEQKAIAEYLDSACQKIDRVIELKEKQAETMKSHLASKFYEALTKGNCNDELRDSEINWMGDMPKSWERKRLKDILHLKSGDGITSTEIRQEGKYPVYGGNGLRGYSDSFTHDGYFPLIGRQGALCGNINYAKGKFWASEHAVVAKPTRKINVYWAGELMRVMNLNQYSNAAAQPGLAVEKIKNLYIPYPAFEEQCQIANYLKGYEEKTMRSVSIIEGQIKILKNYRKSLIHECVTGKKRVDETDLSEEAEMA